MVLLGFKIALVTAVAGTAIFVIDYTRLTRWACWRDPLGVTLCIEALAALGYLVPVLLSVFFGMTPLEEKVLNWALICFIGLGGLVLVWRTLVFENIARRERKAVKTPTVPVEEIPE